MARGVTKVISGSTYAARRSRYAVVFLLAALGGCSNGSTRETQPTERGPDRVDVGYPARIASQLGCDEVSPLNGMILPLRSVAARTGISCRLGHATLHVFERDGPYASHPEAGSIAEIDRSLGADQLHPRCRTWVIIGERWFIVSDDKSLLTEVGSELGGLVRPVRSVSPEVSYPDAPGCSASS